MLDVGEIRCERMNYDKKLISWQVGDAEKLPFDDNSFNAYTIAFGIRNVTHIDKVSSLYGKLISVITWQRKRLLL